MTVPTVADFTSCAFSHQVVGYEAADAGEVRRFHLLFAYIGQRGTVASGDQVVMARDLGQAAVRIARERGVSQLFVRKRFFSGRPASEAEQVNVVFDIA
ncbi:hypothetical protein [Bosea minatitlanensis]|uniref:Uncharacterized protein n=1 Tax=Bosea minatitlanensis TaxID=128782 RepID=A0ABW0F166_9HYPH|nr:hypothetical protein [Bosea minatitlanensis]MCT4492729.1 hypothetical protein [Bosea minatitlanensis]